MTKKTEDKVRDEARILLDFYQDNKTKNLCDVGQLTTFNQLGFKGVLDKPDGWYLPENSNEVAIILEVKNSEIDINKDFCIKELFKNIDIVKTKYKKIVGILYNGEDVLVFKDKVLVDLKKQLFKKEYYFSLYNKNTIDKSLIFKLTEKINNNLHNKFGMKNLYHRMIFTACALVAQRYNINCLQYGMDWSTIHSSILSTIKKSYEDSKKQNLKIDLIASQFSLVESSINENEDSVNEFISCVNQISENINSDYWNGEDVMAIFFNEFTRYKGKSELGQVFTPDHITSLIYRITETSYKDNVLDACCGSGSFLVKAMSYMINEVGGLAAKDEVKTIKEERLYGVEFSKDLYALACANMLIHKDGKTNLIQEDTRTDLVSDWIKSKNITKVLMNPPYENKFGCIEIVENVINSVSKGAISAFILPDNKLEKSKNKVKKWLKKHSLIKIIKLPNVFAGMASVETSIFIFKSHEPQNNKKIFTCWIKDDGLEIVKNKGRMDVKNKWNEIENHWVEIIYKQSGDNSIKWIDSEECLMYKKEDKEFEIFESDFHKEILKYIIFSKKEEFSDYYEIFNLLGNIDVKNKNKLDIKNWKSFKLEDIFHIERGRGITTDKINIEDNIKEDFNINYISATANFNGISSYVSNQDSKKYKLKAITIANNGSIGESFYQEKDFCASSDVTILVPIGFELNKKNAFFLIPVIKKLSYKYNYGSKWGIEKMRQDVIMLPIKYIEENKYVIDIEYMENFINNMLIKIEKHDTLS